MMRVDQTRHDQAAAGIDSAVRRVRPRDNLTDLDDPLSFDVNTAALDKAIVFIEGDQMSIGYQQGVHRISLSLPRIDLLAEPVGRG